MIVIAGGTGFLGGALAAALAADGHSVTILTRKRTQGGGSRDAARATPGSIVYVEWQPNGTAGAWKSALDGAEAAVNLAGESIAAHRWTASQKVRIANSRVQATRSLVAAVAAVSKPPAVFVSASAIGYYGDRPNEVLTESAAPGDDFLATLCVQWEREAMRANSPRTRVAFIRTGIALHPSGGALRKMLPPFRAFIGGPLGSGRQCMSWIHRGDWVALVRWIITNREATGPINGTAPEPATNAEFSTALGRALHRPSLLPTPAFALRLLLGEMADPLLLASQRVLPARAKELGFQFSYPRLEPALQALFAA